jgi:hypothetical protein
MLEVKNVKVYDLAESIVASGYAMGLNIGDFSGRVVTLNKHITKETLPGFIQFYNKEHKLGKKFDEICDSIGLNEENKNDLRIVLKELKRMSRLVQASKNSDNVKCHHNALTGIRVSFDLIYPNYISPEMQRYHWFDIVTSSSKMHRITKMNFDECCNKYVTQETKDNMKKYIDEYNSLFDGPGTPDAESVYKAFMKVLSNCPQGVELFMRISTNYMQLQTMYFQRKNHRLKEDWGAFCEFVEKLPLFKLLITGEMTIEDID